MICLEGLEISIEFSRHGEYLLIENEKRCVFNASALVVAIDSRRRKLVAIRNNLRNFLLMLSTEILGIFQQLREAVIRSENCAVRF